MRLSVVIAVICLSTGGLAAAENVHAAVKEHTNIPAQALASALHTLAKARDFQLIYVSEDVSDLRTSGAVGELTSEEALQKLLNGTGLSFRYLDAKTVTIVPASGSVTKNTGTVSTAGGSSIPRPSATFASLVDVDDGTDGQDGSGGQNAPGEGISDDEKKPRFELEEIVITGSRIRGAQNASPVVMITREQLDRAGFATVEEFIDKLPQNFGAGASLDTSTDFVNTTQVVGGRVDARAGGASINLRGLGASSTLVLLNGRRINASGLTARFTNISSIPVTAIDRVEVLTDGASAIYGSDAIGGVVNFILREDYEGAETRLRYGTDGRGDYSTILLGQSLGTYWSDGNLLFTYEFYNGDNLANRDRAITSTNDLTRFGGTDWRTPGGRPANVIANGQTFAIPSIQDAASLSADDFDPSAPLNLWNARSVGDVLPAVSRHSALLHFNQSLGATQLFVGMRSASQDITTWSNRGTLDLNVPNTNPYFIDPTDSGLTAVRVDNYSFEEDLPSLGFGEIESLGGVVGARFQFGGSWRMEVAGNWSRERATSGNDLSLDREALDAALSSADPDLAFNPFSGGRVNAAVIDSFIVRSRDVGSRSENELWAIGLDVDGDAYDLPAGALQIAAGIEFREESLLSRQVSGSSEVISDTSRDVMAAYAELFLPIVGELNNSRDTHRLELSLAGRYERYSDFGSSMNPKVGILWAPTQSIILRSTYGTSYRAPALFDLNVTIPLANNASYIPDVFVPPLPFPLIVRDGGNEDLRAEEATIWTAGFEWTPDSVAGLSLDVTYFDVDFRDRIASPTSDIVQAATDPRFRTLISLNPTADQIAALVEDPRWLESFAGFVTPMEDLLSGSVPVGAILDLRKANLSQQIVRGMDVQLSYNVDTNLGRINVGLNGSYLFDYKRRFIEADPLVDEVDILGRPIDFRARGHMSWSREEWSLSAFMNYMDGYSAAATNSARRVESWTTMDLTLGYEVGSDQSIFSGTRVSVTAQNLFNEPPPFVDTLGGLGYDSTNGNPVGRFMALQITKEWW